MTHKILFCATVDYHFKAFHLPILEWFKGLGWEVHVAAKGDLELPFVDRRFHLSIQRSPFHPDNIKAYQELKAIVSEQQYEIIHCHTPMGGVLTRLAAQASRKTGTKVVYTAHGFHFCKGAPLLNWLLYYPIEKRLSSVTDCLIAINDEDYNLAIARGFHSNRIAHVHGVGVNTMNYKPVSADEQRRLRQELNYRSDDFLLFYAAEFNKNKNHRLLIQAIALLKGHVPGVRLLLAGEGPLLEACREQAVQLGVASKVHFLGYRQDIDRLLPMCDAAVSSSNREGLPVNIMEAMACGLPVVATKNRGHSELIIDGENGFLIHPDDATQFANRLKELWESAELRKRMGKQSRQFMQMYSLTQVKQELSEIYMSLMNDPEYELRRIQWTVQ